MESSWIEISINREKGEVTISLSSDKYHAGLRRSSLSWFLVFDYLHLFKNAEPATGGIL